MGEAVKIAAFFSDSPFASWTQSRGFAAVLQRMGHEVVDVPIPAGYKEMRQIKRTLVERVNKPIDGCELIIVSGPEHLQRWIQQFYPQWAKLKVPKVGWYHESFHAREDYQMNYEAFREHYNFHIFPDVDDAAKYKGEFLSLGVDTEMFQPHMIDGQYGTIPQERDIDCAFIGLMYPKRQRFAQALGPHLNGLEIRIATVLAQDLDGVSVQKTAEILAGEYRRIKILTAFPSLSNVLVAKPLEAGACGCAVIVSQSHGLENVVTYDESRPETLAEKARFLLANPSECERISQALCEEVHTKHRMEMRFERIFEIAGVKETIQVST
jgi:glycosyl transferase family 1